MFAFNAWNLEDVKCNFKNIMSGQIQQPQEWGKGIPSHTTPCIYSLYKSRDYEVHRVIICFDSEAAAAAAAEADFQ